MTRTTRHDKTPRQRRFLAGGMATLALGLSLAGCGSDTPEQIKLTGQLEARAEAGRIDAQTSARISLVEHSVSTDHDQIVAERTLHGIQRLPTDFTLRVGSALLDTANEYGLSAQLLNDDSEIIWQTNVPTAVDVFSPDKTIKLTLMPYRVAPEGPFVTYRCSDGFRFQLSHDAKGAVVRLGKRQISLHVAKSLTAGATRYVDAHNDEIVSENGVTSIYFDGISHHGCSPVPDESTSSGTAD
mgnify:CR=1 FL=1